MIKCIIVDDEQHCVDALAAMLRVKFAAEVQVITTAGNKTDAKKKIEMERPDLVFLDVEMPGGSGLDLLAELQEPKPISIFTTAHEKYALNALRQQATDYLLKPIDLKELEDALARAKERLSANKYADNTRSSRVSLPTGRGVLIVDFEEIIRIEATNNYSQVVFTNRKSILLAKTLKIFEDILQPFPFYRVHQSHLVNMHHIVRYEIADPGFLYLSNGDKLEISRRRKPEFTRYLNDFYKGRSTQ